MIGHTSKVLLGVGLVLCVTLYWTQSRIDASAVPGPRPEVQPQFLTLGLLGGGGAARPKDDVVLRGKGKAGSRQRAVQARGGEQEEDKTSTPSLDALLDVSFLSEKPPKYITTAAATVEKKQQQQQQEPSSSNGEAPTEGDEEQQPMDWDESNKPKITVLVWNQINGYVDWLRNDFLTDARTKCSTECVFTSDRGQLGNAQGVLFHGPNHDPHDFPPHKAEGQKWVFMSLEQPHYFRDPSLLRDEGYRRRFDYTSTYELDSTVPITCIHPHWDADFYHSLQPLDFDEKDGFGSPGAAVMFTSNCRNAGAEKRLQYLEELGRHMDVHSYGKCLHNKDEPPAPQGVSRAVNKQRVLARYKFYLAFENNVIRDYVSEKVFDGLLSGSLPVYWGTASIDRYMPTAGTSHPPAVIRANAFAGPKELAAYLQTVASNRTLYESYFAWKKAPTPPSQAFRRVLESTAYKYTSMCNLCEALARKKRGRRALEEGGPPPPPLMDFTAV